MQQVVVLLLVAATAAFAQVNPGVDLTITPGSRGSEVVEATLSRVTRQGIFGDDAGFMRRLAYIESEDGASSNLANNGGIWQVNDYYFRASRSSSLASYHQAISTKFNITWSQVQPSDLQKPLYSSLAARLFLQTLPVSIPKTLSEQSNFWFQYYNQRDATSYSFIEENVERENQTIACTPKIDLVVVMDASGSVGLSNFELASQFVASLLDRVGNVASRLAYISFDSFVDVVFNLNNALSMAQIRSAVLNLPYSGGGTDTNAAIKGAVDTFLGATPRPGVPRVMMTFTDGQSGTPLTNIGLAKNNSVNSFAFGIGTGINQNELLTLAYNIPGNVVIVTNYNELDAYVGRVLAQTCGVLLKPSFNQTIPDDLALGERRLYSFGITSAGLTFSLNQISGNVTAMWSFEDPAPTAAFNDGSSRASKFFVPKLNGAGELYMTVRANAASSYTLTAYVGNV